MRFVGYPHQTKGLMGRFVGIAALCVALTPALSVAADFFVNCHGVPAAVNFQTIQAAIDAATTRRGAREIQICRGTYAENLVIDHGGKLTLTGQSRHGVTLTGIPGTAGPIIDILGTVNQVRIAHLTVDGQAQLTADGEPIFGIRSTRGAELYRVHVRNIRDASNDNVAGLGVAFIGDCCEGEDCEGEDGERGSTLRSKVLHSDFSGNSRVSILADGCNVILEARKNHIEAPESPRLAHDGIQVSRGARGRITHNTVRNALGTGQPSGEVASEGSGIIAFCPGDLPSTLIMDNTVRGSGVGIAIVDAGGVRATGNNLRSNRTGIARQVIGNIFGTSPCQLPLSDRRNVMMNNSIRNSEEFGFHFISFDQAVGIPENDRFFDNDIRNSGLEGGHVFEGNNLLIRDNSIRRTQVGFDLVDETAGGGTSGTANIYRRNDCESSFPDRLCD